MKLDFAKAKISNAKFDVIDNILVIKGNNNTGKTTLANDMYKSFLGAKEMFIDNTKLIREDYFPVLLSELFDLKKEINLAKTSSLRTKLIQFLYNNENFSDKELFEKMTQIFSESNLIQELNQNIFDEIKNDFYKITSQIKLNNIEDVVDNVLNVKVVDNDDKEITESQINAGSLKWLYLKILLKIAAERKIALIIDCPETYFSSLEQDHLIEIINTITKNSLVILLTRSNSFIQKLGLIKQSFYLINNEYEIKKFVIGKQTIFNYLSLKNYNQEKFPNYEIYQEKVRTVLEEEDYNQVFAKIFNYYIRDVLTIFDSNEFELITIYELVYQKVDALILILLIIKSCSNTIITYEEKTLEKIFKTKVDTIRMFL